MAETGWVRVRMCMLYINWWQWRTACPCVASTPSCSYMYLMSQATIIHHSFLHWTSSSSLSWNEHRSQLSPTHGPRFTKFNFQSANKRWSVARVGHKMIIPVITGAEGERPSIWVLQLSAFPHHFHKVLLTSFLRRDYLLPCKCAIMLGDQAVPLFPSIQKVPYFTGKRPWNHTAVSWIIGINLPPSFHISCTILFRITRAVIVIAKSNKE